MNILLEKMLDKSSLSEKDKYEIRQIFEFSTDDKKRNILMNFNYILESINKIKQDLYRQQEILLGKAISNIERVLWQAKKTWLRKEITDEIISLKNTI